MRIRVVEDRSPMRISIRRTKGENMHSPAFFFTWLLQPVLLSLHQSFPPDVAETIAFLECYKHVKIAF
jgi:hypothetical protein